MKDGGLQVALSYRQILKMAGPISFAALIPQLNYVTNNIFLGHYSKQALAIAGVTGVYYLIFSAIGYGLNNGLQALISRRAGENKPDEIGKLFNQSLLVGMIINIVGIALTYTITPFLFELFIKDPERLQQAIGYTKIRIWGLPFLYVYQMRNALLVGTNQSKYLMAGAVAEAGTNILFDYLLIFGHWGMPEMGLNGAAVASIIAEVTGLVVIYAVIWKRGITGRFQLFKDLKWDSHNISLLLSMSAPLIFQYGISILSWEYFFLMIDSHGETALAVSNTMRNVIGLTGVVTWSFGATSNAMVSNIIGQGKTEQVWELMGKIMRLSTGAALLMALFLNLFPDLLFHIYGQSGEFVDQAVPVVRVLSIAIIIMSFSTVFINSVIGTGNSRASLYIEIFAIVIYCIYVYLVLGKYNLSITYGWMSEWVYWTCMFLPAFWYMKSGKWKNKVI